MPNALTQYTLLSYGQQLTDDLLYLIPSLLQRGTWQK